MIPSCTSSNDNNKIKIFNPDNKQSCFFKSSSGNDRFCKPLCYITNFVSKAIPQTTQKSYDAIFCAAKVLISESSAIENAKESEEIQYKATQPYKMPEYTPDWRARIKHCGNHGLIYTVHNKLYQLKLDDIKADDQTDNKSFNEIMVQQEHQIWDFHCDIPMFSPYFIKFFSWIYLGDHKSQIFAIFNQELCMSHAVTNTETHKCGIFDLNEKKWTEIRPLKLDLKNNEFIALYMNEYDNDIIYAISNNENVQRYDFDENMWYEVVKKSEKNNPHLAHDIIWMEDIHTLCCGGEDGFFYSSINLSNDNPTWNLYWNWMYDTGRGNAAMVVV